MFGIGMPELIIILAVALIVIGPKKLPDMAKSLGKAMREFRNATSEFKDAIDVNDDFKGMKNALSDLNKPLKTKKDPIQQKVGDKSSTDHEPEKAVESVELHPKNESTDDVSEIESDKTVTDPPPIEKGKPHAG